MPHSEADIADLRKALLSFVKQKFRSRYSICFWADDIVNQAILDTFKMADEQKLNFGYLSKVCIHIAYSYYKKMDIGESNCLELEDCLNFLCTEDIVAEIIAKENAEEILTSLDVLKQIERIVILQRYYGEYSFNEIANSNGLKLNTVLSHHRRALEKLRPRLSAFSSGRIKNVVEQVTESNCKDKHFSKYF